MQKNNYNIYKNVIVKSYSKKDNDSLYNALNSFEYGFFEWKYDDNILLLNEFLINNFQIIFKPGLTISDVFSTRLDENTELLFYSSLEKIVTTKSKLSFELPVRNKSSVQWYSLKLFYNDISNSTIGLLQSVQKPNTQTLSIENSDNISSKLLINLPSPVFYIDFSGEVIYQNQIYTDIIKAIHSVIEKKIIRTNLDNFEYEWIKSIELLDLNRENYVFNISYTHLNSIKNIVVTRKILAINNFDCIMYVHQNTKILHNKQNQLLKVLRANELINEIRDIVDNLSDLDKMFEYLLTKIHTVIPAANLCCILQNDKNGNMSIKSSYGFDKEYVDSFNIPFKSSFANLNLLNDYSKSVIINDIQEKYSDLFPTIKEELFGIITQSNIATPLVVNGVLYGILSVDSGENRVFDSVDLSLLDYMKVQIERAIEKYHKYLIITRDSNLDPLTGISNRRSLKIIFNQIVQKNKIENSKFSFVVFDIDKLKQVNDNYGHASGDIIIKQFVSVAQNHIRQTDLISRIGGDEFVGIFQNIEKDVLISRIGLWIKSLEDQPNNFNDDEIITEFSYGFAEFPTEADTFEKLLELADKRMYNQKNNK